MTDTGMNRHNNMAELNWLIEPSIWIIRFPELKEI
jgi:hypothetical protein